MFVARFCLFVCLFVCLVLCCVCVCLMRLHTTICKIDNIFKFLSVFKEFHLFGSLCDLAAWYLGAQLFSKHATCWPTQYFKASKYFNILQAEIGDAENLSIFCSIFGNHLFAMINEKWCLEAIFKIFFFLILLSTTL